MVESEKLACLGCDDSRDRRRVHLGSQGVEGPTRVADSAVPVAVLLLVFTPFAIYQSYRDLEERVASDELTGKWLHALNTAESNPVSRQGTGEPQTDASGAAV